MRRDFRRGILRRMTLTGPDATKALQLYSRLGATGARFDASKVARDVRTRAGRSKLAFALAHRIGKVGMAVRLPHARPRGLRVRRSRSVRGGARKKSRSEHHPDPGVPVGTLTARPERVMAG